MGFGDNPELRHLLSITPSREEYVQEGRGKIMVYGDVTCTFVKNRSIGIWALLTVTVNGKEYSMLGVSNAR